MNLLNQSSTLFDLNTRKGGMEFKYYIYTHTHNHTFVSFLSPSYYDNKEYKEETEYGFTF